MKMRTITCFGDWTSDTFLIIMYLFIYVCMHGCMHAYSVHTFIEAPFTELFSHNILKFQLIKITTINYKRNKSKSTLC